MRSEMTKKVLSETPESVTDKADKYASLLSENKMTQKEQTAVDWFLANAYWDDVACRYRIHYSSGLITFCRFANAGYK